MHHCQGLVEKKLSEMLSPGIANRFVQGCAVAACVWRVGGNFLVRETALLGSSGGRQGSCGAAERGWTLFFPLVALQAAFQQR